MSEQGKSTCLSLAFSDGSGYDVRIGYGILPDLGARMRAVPACADAVHAVVISDSHVAPLYSAQVVRSLREAGFRAHSVSIEAGEASKNIEVASELWSALAYFGLSRTDCVVSLGGGVVGDVAGFAASTYLRGIPLVHVPTSLLAMVDSSVGGKTALNLPAGKNMVGNVYQPAYVHADVGTLSTLSHREMACGWAELAKTALLADDAFLFDALDAARQGAAQPETQTLPEQRERMHQLIVRAAAHKARVVREDPNDISGLRASLNLGHTYGHALEALSGYGTHSHGACVAEGIRFAARVAQAYAGATAEFVRMQDELMDAIACEHIVCKCAPEELLRAMKRDKKARDGGVRFVLLRDVGEWTVQEVPDEFLLEALRVWNSQD